MKISQLAQDSSVTFVVLEVSSSGCVWGASRHHNMARLVDPLVVGRVIGEVLDMFVPCAELSVHYGSKQVSNGVEIKPSLAAAKPTVRINGSRDPSTLFTLVSSHFYSVNELFKFIW